MLQTLFLSILLVVSPIWPLGENPLVGDPYIIVNKQTNQLAYINEGVIQNVYSVATGTQNELTPEGEFMIVVKAPNPYYRKKDIEGGAKENPLGTRWIGFDALETDGRIYGVHGTNLPQSIGHYVTAGCVRMENNQVEELYEEIPLGTKILIVNTNESFEYLAREAGALP
ncbi:L,D-transpeptidase [Alkalihalobacterium alkalinitrilicum]|uniref:L,D-transpeptidase n=1 Tax=Alkalihalobacterium alkalinitrilicum TaxID=427920 RepID=UPI0009957C81|nr:L,D-transpeptidase [Alkalihalobacterium alkalinitrilicum]